MSNKIKIICTLGPASFNSEVLQKLNKQNIDISRINLSHTNKSDIKKRIIYLKKQKVKNICLDTEGAQIRTTETKKNYFLKKNKVIKLSIEEKTSDINCIYLYPKFDLLTLPLKTKIYIGFENLCLQVMKKDKSKNKLHCKITKSGYLQSKKGVHIDYPVKLNALTQKDIFALNLGKSLGVKHFAISFVNNHKDIYEVIKIVGNNKKIISKIETLNAIKDLKKITKVSNALLIDRGDLSRYIPIEEIPLIQERIIQKTKKLNKPVYIATNLLENMIEKSQPTRAESHDVYSSLKEGAEGLVLAAETAIGVNPVECVKFLRRCIDVFRKRNIN